MEYRKPTLVEYQLDDDCFVEMVVSGEGEPGWMSLNPEDQGLLNGE